VFSPPQSLLERLEGELWQTVDSINQEIMQKLFDTRKLSKEELQAQIDAGDKEAGTANKITRWEGETLIVEWGPSEAPTKTVRITVASSPIDRIKAKALQARSVAPDAIKAFETDLDSILAEKPILAQKQAAAVAPHKEAIAGVFGEIDGLKSAMDLLTNGGPPLDESNTSAQGS
jgi:hypothetical protein